MSWRESLGSLGLAEFDDPEEARMAAEVLGRVDTQEVLKPRPLGDGWSLSDTYGYDAFPWHTDAAVSVRPPRWFVLTAEEVSEPTQTEITIPPAGVVANMRRSPLRVRDRRGRVRYLPAAVVESYGDRLRWDPRVATPLAPELTEEVAALAAMHSIDWSPGLSVIVDNHRTLHRRPSVSADRTRTLARYYVWTN